eukprot:6099452-Ditylum_brightwellii.AAC.1
MLEVTEDTICQVTKSFSYMKSQHTSETGEDQESLNIDNNEQLPTQESAKNNKTDQGIENETLKVKPVVKEPAQQDHGNDHT